jgi:hypothetical protein
LKLYKPTLGDILRYPVYFDHSRDIVLLVNKTVLRDFHYRVELSDVWQLDVPHLAVDPGRLPSQAFQGENTSANLINGTSEASRLLAARSIVILILDLAILEKITLLHSSRSPTLGSINLIRRGVLQGSRLRDDENVSADSKKFNMPDLVEFRYEWSRDLTDEQFVHKVGKLLLKDEEGMDMNAEERSDEDSDRISSLSDLD